MAGAPVELTPRLIVTVSCWSWRSSSERSFSTMRRTSSLSLRMSIMIGFSERGPLQVPGHGGELACAGVGDEVVVLEADAADAGQIDAGLDGDDHAGLERGRGDHVRE